MSRPPQTPSTPPDDTPAKALARDELADQELKSFLSELEGDIQPQASSNSRTKYTRLSRSGPSVESTTAPELEHESLDSQLLPTTMSCRAAFDQLYYCNSLGGRWNDLYRYGTLRSCADDWDDFWFCMRTRLYSEKAKAAAVKEHYREKERKKYSKELGKASSENVWKSRESKVEWGTAFKEKFEKVENDDEWRRRELERRREMADSATG